MICKLLIERGAALNHVSKAGLTALMAAAKAKNYETAMLLIENGCNVKKVDNHNSNALHFAVPGPNDLLELLIFSGINPNQTDKSGFTPLMIACHKSNCGNALTLANYGGDFYAGNESAWQLATDEVQSHLQRYGHFDFPTPPFML